LYLEIIKTNVVYSAAQKSKIGISAHISELYTRQSLVLMAKIRRENILDNDIRTCVLYMSGELKLPSQGGAPAVTPNTAASSSTTPSTIVELKNMLTLKDLELDNDYNEIVEDTTEECSQFGKLKSVVIPRDGPGVTKIFLQYATTKDSENAINGLAGRSFDGRKVVATYFDEEKFAQKDYSD